MLIEAAELAAGAAPPACGYDADIIILTFNRYTETLEAVGSALRQTGLNFHVIVLDQGSAPAVQADFVKAFGGRQNLGYFTIGKNLGVAGGRNLLARLGTGRILIALDNDAEFANETTAASAMRAFDAQPELGALGFKILDRNGVKLDDSSWGYPLPLKQRCNGRFEATTFVGAGHAIRRLTWEQAGGYDESLFFTWEEYDFCLAAIALNWRIAFDGSLAIIHKVSAEERVHWNAARMRYFIRNRLIIARKWGAPWICLLPRMAGYLAKAYMNGVLRAAMTGIKEAIQADKSYQKRQMPAFMRDYISRNETRHRGALLQQVRLGALGKIKGG